MRKGLPAVLVAVCAAWAVPARAAAAAPDSDRAWAEYRVKAHRDIAAAERRISALEAEAKTAGSETRRRLQAESKALRAEKADAERQLAQFESATDAARKELKAKLDRDLRELEKAAGKPSPKLRVTP